MPKNRKDDHAPRAGRRPRLTPTARAQGQRDAFSRRVQRRAAHILRYGPMPKPDEAKPSWEHFPWATFFNSVHYNPVRLTNRVTGLPTRR